MNICFIVSVSVALDNQTIASNIFAFFLGGFETISSTMSFFLFELAANKQIQDGVRSEILKTLDKHSGEINYDTIKELEFTDMVISGNHQCIR